MPLSKLILGTHNAKKGRELAELLAPLGIVVQTLSEFDDPLHVVEDGETFAANAALKATQQAQHLGNWVLGEDSGLVVDALDGAPGVYSARFAGEDATDEANNRLLLERLGDAPPEKRSAHYVCQMACGPKRAANAMDAFAKSPPEAAALGTIRSSRLLSTTTHSDNLVRR